MSYTAYFVSSDWLPIPAAVNELPEPVRRYIHNLETRCDPAGDIATIACLTEQRDALALWLMSNREWIGHLERQLEYAKQATDHKLREALAWAMAALESHGPAPSHIGPCGPESNCDALCAESASFAERFLQIKREHPWLESSTGK